MPSHPQAGVIGLARSGSAFNRLRETMHEQHPVFEVPSNPDVRVWRLRGFPGIPVYAPKGRGVTICPN
jgi:hypothetical protein